MDVLYCKPSEAAQKSNAWSRQQIAQRLDAFEAMDSPWISHAQIARFLDVPRTTLEYWLKQRESLRRESNLPGEVIDFFESPIGLAFLHQLIGAAHLVFVQANDCGIRNLCWFLELSRLNTFVAASYGAQHAVASQMESLIVTFGQEEDQRLAANMPAQEISLCQDETFHPEMCLVAIEPVSNFILLEQYQPQRDAATWNACMDQVLGNLPITVIQCATDQAKALITHAQTHLGAHHSPDVFHVQHEVSQATSFALSNQTRAAQSQLEKACEQVQRLHLELQACQQQCPQSDHGSSLQAQLRDAEEVQQKAEKNLEDCQARQQQAADARRGISRDYHPFDLTTATPCTAHEVASRLQRHFDQPRTIADEANLSQNSREKIAKARRVLAALIATISFYWSTVKMRLCKWNLPQPVAALMISDLIPAHYLQIAAAKASTSQERQRLRELSQLIFARARSPTGVWATLDPQIQEDLEQKALRCAQIFQRSSSCVEGHKGHLSLKHHALHRLTSTRLQALKVLHNYAAYRTDGTTAAERFYGEPPRDIFTWTLDRLDLPARPRTSRAN
jgi:hypothetical protein